jgi:hypothetical protein
MTEYFIITGGMLLFSAIVVFLDYLGRRQRHRREQKH